MLQILQILIELDAIFSFKCPDFAMIIDYLNVCGLNFQILALKGWLDLLSSDESSAAKSIKFFEDALS